MIKIQDSKPSDSLLKVRVSNFEICFEFRTLSFEFCAIAAFTIIELLVVIAIMIILAGLILSTVGYVQNKGARSRAETEIAAISAALENYKADNGTYPTDPTKTEMLDPAANIDLTKYATASLYLYKQLSGDINANRQPAATAKTYFTFKPNQLSPSDQTQPVTGIRDPFGNSYGYSTVKAANPTGTVGYNPTFDLWSTAGATSGAPNQTQWIKNW
ncbi:MAG TPA: type II secretion system protein GspG [Chthoniobacterales bacterium]|nr:type II secretion system protein GspG [Chthoniobacterales bacterium]